MTNLPRLELTEDPNKNNEFIIFRYSSKGKKTKQSKTSSIKRVHKKKTRNKKEKTSKNQKRFFQYILNKVSKIRLVLFMFYQI